MKLLVNCRLLGNSRLKLWLKDGIYIVELDGRTLNVFTKEHDAIIYFKEVA